MQTRTGLNSQISSFQENLLRTLDRTADWAGVGPRAFSAEELMATALRRAGRRRFSDLSFVTGLRRLLEACEQEADLSVFGRFAARFDVLRALSNVLSFDAADQADPSIATRRIAQPVFMTGLPRSGTTFLHTLLGLDPANAVPRSWQLIYPYPTGTPDRRKERVERQLRTFRHFSPGLEGMHPIAADAPQECTDITAHVFQSLRFDTTYHIPSYQRWIDARGHLDAFRFHRRFLQHLDVQSPGRHWILKCPDHVFTLDAIRAVYPDARFVVLHREPLDVLGSVAKLTDLLRRPFTRHVDREAIGRQVSERWADGADRMVRLLDHPPEQKVLHLHHRDVVARPMEAVAAIYRHCDRPLDRLAAARMRAYVETTPRGGYGEHHYDLAEFGLDAASLEGRFADYRQAFGFARRCRQSAA